MGSKICVFIKKISVPQQLEKDARKGNHARFTPRRKCIRRESRNHMRDLTNSQRTGRLQSRTSTMARKCRGKGRISRN